MVRNRPALSDFEQLIDSMEVISCSFILGMGFAFTMARMYIPADQNKNQRKRE